mgnify:CR=1 FL=1
MLKGLLFTTEEIAKYALEMLEIDNLGLDNTDRKMKKPEGLFPGLQVLYDRSGCCGKSIVATIVFAITI